MPVDKILNKIRDQITDLAPQLAGFADTTIQPGVEDCAQLQQRLLELLEQIAIYKYNKQNYELSPSFNLHARISETSEAAEQEQTSHAEAAPAPPEPKGAPEKPAQQPKNGGPRNARALHIGLNDKFRFINELFAHNNAEYNIALEQLNNLQTWNESDIYLNSLKNLYGWKENHDAVKYFYSLVKKRFQ